MLILSSQNTYPPRVHPFECERMRAPASRRGTTSIRALGYVTSSVDNLGRETFKQFDGLEGVPPADLHDDPWIHLAINEKPLGEASPEIVR